MFKGIVGYGYISYSFTNQSTKYTFYLKKNNKLALVGHDKMPSPQLICRKLQTKDTPRTGTSFTWHLLAPKQLYVKHQGDLWIHASLALPPRYIPRRQRFKCQQKKRLTITFPIWPFHILLMNQVLASSCLKFHFILTCYPSDFSQRSLPITHRNTSFKLKVNSFLKSLYHSGSNWKCPSNALNLEWRWWANFSQDNYGAIVENTLLFEFMDLERKTMQQEFCSQQVADITITRMPRKQTGNQWTKSFTSLPFGFELLSPWLH